MKPTTKTELLKTIRQELNKEFIQFDLSGRPSLKYTAPITATDGTPCFVVEYIYSGAFPNTIIGRKEAYAFWSSAFDSGSVTNYLLDDTFDYLVDDLGNRLLEM